MSTIYDVMRAFRDYVKFDGEIGLEIETETAGAYTPPKMAFWEAKPDGSLRNFGMEYVLRQPVGYGKELDAALQEFSDKTGKIKFMENSITTSVHVHLNMLNQTFKTLANFLTIYCLTENLLIRFSGPDRLSNLFCLPMCDAEGSNRRMLDVINAVNAGQYNGVRLDEQRAKYSALNLATLGKFGSVEVRSFRGVTDIILIKDWTSLLHSMFEYSKQNITPVDIIESYRNIGVEMLNEVFGDYANRVDYEDKADLMNKNLWYAANIVNAVKDWSKFGIPVKKKLTKNKFQARLDNAALGHFGAPYAELNGVQLLAVQEIVQRQLAAANEEAPVALDGAFAGVRNIQNMQVEAAAPAEEQLPHPDDADADDLERIAIQPGQVVWRDDAGRGRGIDGLEAVRQRDLDAARQRVNDRAARQAQELEQVNRARRNAGLNPVDHNGRVVNELAAGQAIPQAPANRAARRAPLNNPFG